MSKVYVLTDRTGGMHGVFTTKALADERITKLNEQASVYPRNHWQVSEFDLVTKASEHEGCGCKC